MELEGVARAVRSTSGWVAPVATRPGRSGEYAELGWGRFDDDEVAVHGTHFCPRFLRPACSRMPFRVPGARSSSPDPAMVTRPGLRGCLNCWWLPRVLSERTAQDRVGWGCKDAVTKGIEIANIKRIPIDGTP